MKTHDASSPPVSSTESRYTSPAETSGSAAGRSSDPKAAIVQGRMTPAERQVWEAQARMTSAERQVLEAHAAVQARITTAERQVWEALAAEQVNPALAVPLV